MKRKFTIAVLLISILALPVGGFAADETETMRVADVTVYGAKGDGSTDDTAALQAAVDALKETGGVVTIPKGEYVVSAPICLYSNIQISGIGPQSKLKGTMTGEDDAIIYGESITGASVDDLAFSNVDAKVPAVSFAGSTYIDVTDLTIEGNAAVRFCAAGTAENRVFSSDVFVKNLVCDGKGAQTVAISMVDTEQAVLSGNKIRNYQNGIYIAHSRVGTTEKPPVNTVCSDCVFNDISGAAIKTDGQERVSIGTNIIRNVGIGIEVCHAKFTALANNVITQPKITGISITEGGDGVNIMSNAVYSSEDKSCLLNVADTSLPYAHKAVNITANTFHNNGNLRSNIRIGSVDALSVTSNHFYNTTLDAATSPIRSSLIGDNQMIYETAYPDPIVPVKAGKTGLAGELMIQNNHIDAIEAPKAGSVGIVVLQDDAQQSPLTYIKGNSVRGFLVDMRVQAMSTNPQVKPVFLVKNNYFGGRFEREEGNTQSSVVILEDNFSSKTGGNFPAQIPEEGKWEKGQIVYFDNPQPGSYVGAVCIAKGTPGVWKLFGKIEE